MKAIISLLVAAISVAFVLATPLHSKEFRKCTIDAVITGVGVPATSITGSKFVGWARARNGSRAADLIDNIARGCLTAALKANADRIPGQCESNTRLLENSNRPLGGALTGFQLTRGLDALKATVCSNPSFGTNYQRSGADVLYDKRVIQGFRVSFRKLGGSGACRGTNLWPTREVTVMCKATEGMQRYERFPTRLYRVSSGWPQPEACKPAFSVRGRGNTTPEAKSDAQEGWLEFVARNHGAEYADANKASAVETKCVRKLQGRYKAECVMTARPCYY